MSYMHEDPVKTLKRTFKPPGSVSRNSSTSSGHGGPSALSTPTARGAAAPHSFYGGGGREGSVLPQAKRARLSLGAGTVYRDDETTGFEDDGSESVHTWVTPRVGLSPIGARQKSNGVHLGNNGSAAKDGQERSLYYSCLWRKPQFKKHKTWEGDGVLIVTNGKGILKDKSSAKEIGSGKILGGKVILGEEFTLGSKEVEVEGPISEKSYLDGSIFGNNASQAVPANILAINASSTTSFYGPTVAKKFVPPVSSLTSRAQSPYIPHRPAAPVLHIQDPQPPKSFYNEDDDILPNPSALVKAFNNVGTTSKMVSAGLGATMKKVPKPLHNPDLPKAIVMTRPSEEHDKKFNKKKNTIVDVVVDPTIGDKLRPHQIEGVKFMYECVMGMKTEGHGCILADEMGLGKTIQSIALLWTLLKQNPYYGEPVIRRALIVCPVSLVKNWGKECFKWLSTSRINVFMADSKNDIKNFGRNKHSQVAIIGYEKLRTVVDELKSIQPPIGLIICDEGHRLKSAGAKTTKALQAFSTKRRVILTGTPIQNELSEFHSMVDFINPGLFDDWNCFKRTYEQPILKSREPKATADVKELGQARGEALGAITRKFVLRRTSEVIAGYLPPKSEYVVFVAPTKTQTDIYKRVLGSGAIKDVLLGGSSGLQLITLLKKLCNSPGLLVSGDDNQKGDDELQQQFVALLQGLNPMAENLSGKLIALAALLKTLKEETDEKIVLVSSFVQTLNVLEKLCQRKGYNYCRLDGKVKQQDRQSTVDNFNRTRQSDKFVFLLSAKAGGVGLNIIGASRLVLFDSDWNPSTDLQAMARIHRDGQKRPCVIYRFLTTGTMDEKIYQRQIMKQGLAGSLMDDGKAGELKEGGADAFSMKELKEIFRLHEDTACQTHELLGCGCLSGQIDEVPTSDAEQGQDGSSSDSDMEDLPSFTSASLYKPAEPEEKALKAQRKLAALKEWAHISCSTEEASLEIEDEVLRDVVTNGLQTLNSKSFYQKRNPWDSDEENQDEDSVEIRGKGVGEKSALPPYEGGEISFVFHKKSAVL